MAAPVGRSALEPSCDGASDLPGPVSGPHTDGTRSRPLDRTRAAVACAIVGPPNHLAVVSCWISRCPDASGRSQPDTRVRGGRPGSDLHIVGERPAWRGKAGPGGWAPREVAAGSAVRNRSEIVTVMTPRGPVGVPRQQVRGLRQGSSWTWFWDRSRKGRGDWVEASTVREAVRKATLLPPRKAPAWLLDAASEAERQVMDSTTSPRALSAQAFANGLVGHQIGADARVGLFGPFDAAADAGGRRLMRT